jgi:hypothetical protein
MFGAHDLNRAFRAVLKKQRPVVSMQRALVFSTGMAGWSVVADDGSTGKSDQEIKNLAVRNSLDDAEVEEFKANAKARQEQCQNEITTWAWWKMTWCWELSTILRCVGTNLCNMQLRIHLLMDSPMTPLEFE